jgi:hypothetical protein
LKTKKDDELNPHKPKGSFFSNSFKNAVRLISGMQFGFCNNSLYGPILLAKLKLKTQNGESG